MSKKLIGLTLALVLCMVAVPASAAGLTQSQISAIIALLQSFGAEQSVINNVSVSLGGGTPNNSGGACIELSYNLFSGSTDNIAGGQVTKLQRFLGVDTTGYFGPATEAAVQRWQAQNGVVSSGSPDTTGYGYVGAKTRAAMARGCGEVVSPIPNPLYKIATIDQNPFIVNTEKDYARVTVTGSASNVERVDIGVKGYSGGSARVVNGRWSATLGDSLPTGTYALQVTDAFSNVVLTTGTLVVKTNMQTRDVQINSFTVSPSSVRAGEVVTFAWSSNLTQNDVSQYGGGCSIEGITRSNVALNVSWGFIEPNGQIGHIPQETAVYTLRCSSSAKDGSAVDTKQVTVNVY